MRATLITSAVLLALAASAPAHGAPQVTPTVRLTAEERYDDDELLRSVGAGELTSRVSPQVGLALADENDAGDVWYANKDRR